MQSELLEQVKTYLMALQDTICQGLENADGKAKFVGFSRDRLADLSSMSLAK